MKKNSAMETRFAELMLGLAQTFSTHLNQSGLEIYWKMLQPYPFESLEQAIMAYCRHPDGHRFMPKPGEIIAYLEGTSSHQALKAWTQVHKAITEIGSYQTVIFDDALTHAVISDMGGWCYLCQTLAKELPFKGQEFQKRYTGYLIHKPNRYPKQLIGLVDANNSMMGYSVKCSPVLIGDKKKALLVFKNGQDVSRIKQYHTVPADKLQYLLKECLEEKKISVDN